MMLWELFSKFVDLPCNTRVVLCDQYGNELKTDRHELEQSRTKNELKIYLSYAGYPFGGVDPAAAIEKSDVKFTFTKGSEGTPQKMKWPDFADGEIK